MGFTFRKALGSNWLKLNISKSGLSISGGPKGIRIVKRLYGKKPTTLYVGGGGLRYIKRISMEEEKPRTANSEDRGNYDIKISVVTFVGEKLDPCISINNKIAQKNIDYFQNMTSSTLDETGILQNKKDIDVDIKEAEKLILDCNEAIVECEKLKYPNVEKFLDACKRYIQALEQSLEYHTIMSGLSFDMSNRIICEQSTDDLQRDIFQYAPEMTALNEKKNSLENDLECELKSLFDQST